MNKVLLLNADYTAIEILTVQRAVSLIFRDSDPVLAATEETFTISNRESSITIPRILVLKKMAKLKGIKLTSQNVFKRDKRVCQYCGTGNLRGLNCTIDHIVPKSKGGENSWTNLVTACKKCNSKKSNSLLSDTELTLINEPRKPKVLKDIVYGAKIHESWKIYL